MPQQATVDTTTQPVMGLEAKYYNDHGIYDKIKTEVFLKTWQMVGHASQFKKAGDYQAFTIFDQELFLIKNRKGEINCFYNVCQHRAHMMVEGKGRKSALACPYHAWTYGLDGELRGAPNSDKVEGFDKSKICLTAVRLEVFCGFIFINLDDDAQPMSECFPGVEEKIRRLCPDIDQHVYVHEHDAEEYCNWLVAVENYNECYHCGVVHPSFASGVIDPASYNIEPGDDVKCLQHSSKPTQDDDGAWYDVSGSDYGSFFFWPASSIQIYPGGMVNTYHWRPLGVDNTRVHRAWYSKDGQIDTALQNVIDNDRDKTFAEDLVLVKSVQRGLQAKGYIPGPLVVDVDEGLLSEHSLTAIHQWIRDAVQ